MEIPLLDQKLCDVRAVDDGYRLFEAMVLDRIHIERLDKATPVRIKEATVRKNINTIIIGHSKVPKICAAIHEHRDSLIDIRNCSNASHACFHGETTIIP